MSLQDLENLTGLTQNYIGSIELGHRDPSLSSVLAISIGLGAHPAELFGTVAALNPTAEEAGRLFDKASADLQAAILAILRLSQAKPRGAGQR